MLTTKIIRKRAYKSAEVRIGIEKVHVSHWVRPSKQKTKFDNILKSSSNMDKKKIEPKSLRWPKQILIAGPTIHEIANEESRDQHVERRVHSSNNGLQQDIIIGLISKSEVKDKIGKKEIKIGKEKRLL